ncbi:MAG: TetR/AcrR family transcriptional regulator [Clostridia bacterium]|nr:TetR/AcrR family transcriptional regulator [Clostridia bacterium]
MTNEHLVRQVLMDNTIRLVADGGFENATTNTITYSGGDVENIKMNVVYIYRLYGSKDRLFDSIFETIDGEFANAVRSSEDICGFMTVVLDFWTQNPLWCKYYVRYYYSHRLVGDVLSKHKENMEELTAKFTVKKPVTEMILTTLLDAAYKAVTAKTEGGFDSLCDVVKEYTAGHLR